MKSNEVKTMISRINEERFMDQIDTTLAEDMVIMLRRLEHQIKMAELRERLDE